MSAGGNVGMNNHLCTVIASNHVGVRMNRSASGWSVKHSHRFDILNTVLYKNMPLLYFVIIILLHHPSVFEAISNFPSPGYQG